MAAVQAGKPVVRFDPTGVAIPLVCDSPHSGTAYPEDFGHAVPLGQLRQGEDTHVDALWEAAPRHGATLIAATFPRTYIDPNRTLADLDPDTLDGPWPEPLSPGEKTRLGKGLVWTRMDPKTAVYDRKLGVAEVQRRIDGYYRPYHESLSRAVQERYEQFGALWHLNLHSMPNDAYERLGLRSDRPLADFVLGDRDGTTCDPTFIGIIEDYLLEQGYTVARNDPFKGVALIERIGRPEENRHSLQIEVNRSLYMDEESYEKSANFAALQQDLTGLTRKVAEFVQSVL